MRDLNYLYFHWMCKQVNATREEGGLLNQLDNIIFEYQDPFDGNRYEDGISLRYRFGYLNGVTPAHIAAEIDNKPCSVFEMMLALAIKCEDIMLDSDKGDQVPQWFWGMVKSLGLIQYGHIISDPQTVESVIGRFIRREYEPNGEGGLFTIPDTKRDLRKEEIWKQLMWYLNYIEERR